MRRSLTALAGLVALFAAIWLAWGSKGRPEVDAVERAIEDERSSASREAPVRSAGELSGEAPLITQADGVSQTEIKRQSTTAERAWSSSKPPTLSSTQGWADVLSRSQHGDAEASYWVAKMLKPLGKQWPDVDAFRPFVGESPDRFHWYRVAARQGSTSAMIDFANDVFNAPPLGVDYLSTLSFDELTSLRDEAVGWLNVAIRRNDPSAFVLAARLLQRNAEPFRYDQAGAFVCMKIASRILGSQADVERIALDMQKSMPKAASDQAARLMQSPQPCKI